MSASNVYDLTIFGSINITDAIYLSNQPLFSANTAIAPEVAYLRAVNVYLQPEPSDSGGVHVNTTREFSSGNLFYIASGTNPNMMVYDSAFDEAQVHFRTLSSSRVANTWRLGTNNQRLYFELERNSPSDLNINGEHTGYSRAMDITARVTDEYDVNIKGHIAMTVPSSTLRLGNGATIATNSSCNLTYTASVHNIVASGTSSSNIANFIDRNDITVTVVDTNGRVGIGSASPRASLDVASGQVFVANGTQSAPTYSFAASGNTGVYHTNNSLRVSANGVLAAAFNGSGSSGNALVVPSFSSTGLTQITSGGRSAITVDINGNVGIGTAVPQHLLHIDNTAVINGDVIPFQTYTYSLGSVSQRWRTLCISDAVNFNGTTAYSLAGRGDLHVDIGVETPRLQLGSVVLTSNNASPSKVAMTLDGIAGTNVVYPVVMGTDKMTSIESLRLTTNTVEPLVVFTSNAQNIATFASTAQASALCVKASGYVGVGTPIPWSPMTVVGRDTVPALSVQQQGTGYIASFSNLSNAGMFIDSNGKVGMGVTYPNSQLHVKGQTYIDGDIIGMSNMYVGLDLVVAGNTYTRFDQIVDSDKRLKSDLKRIDAALNKVSKLTGYTYKYADMEQRCTGVIAQDLLEVLPEAVKINPSTGMYGVEYGSMMGMIIEAIKELKQDIVALKQSIM